MEYRIRETPGPPPAAIRRLIYLHMLSRDLLLAILYCLRSAALPRWFVALCPWYIRNPQMLLSPGTAGGKWLVQVMLGLVLLNDKSLTFLKNTGFVCFIGSCILIPY